MSHFTFCRFTLCRFFDRLSFYPRSFYPSYVGESYIYIHLGCGPPGVQGSFKNSSVWLYVLQQPQFRRILCWSELCLLFLQRRLVWYLVLSSVYSLVTVLDHSFGYLSVYLLVYLWSHSLVYSLVHLLVNSLVYSLVYSLFVH